MTSPLLWYLNRGTGIVLLVIFTASTVVGVLSTSRAASRVWPRFLTQGLHRSLGLLSAGLLVAHAVTAVVDEYVDIRWWQALVPFGGTYKPWYLALGALALDLTAAVVATSLIRHRLGARSWRAVHLLSYAAWGVSVLHTIGIGTDSDTALGRLPLLVCCAAVAAAVLLRLVIVVRHRRYA